LATWGSSGSTRSRSGNVFASRARSARPANGSSGATRHRDGALGERGDPVLGKIVGRDHRLAMPHQHPQAEIVGFRALALLDRALPHLDRERGRAHRNRIGGVGAGAPRGFDAPVGECDEGRLIEQGGHWERWGVGSARAFGKPQMWRAVAWFKPEADDRRRTTEDSAEVGQGNRYFSSSVVHLPSSGYGKLSSIMP